MSDQDFKFTKFDIAEELEHDEEARIKILQDLVGKALVVALVECYGYEESAIVVVRDPETGQLYEWNGSHCSCYGFEGQWLLEETTIDALRARPFYFDSAKTIDDLIAIYADRRKKARKWD